MTTPCELLEALEDYGLEPNNKTLMEALINICTEYNLDAESLGDKWLQFTLNAKVGNQISLDLLSRFRLEGLKMKKRQAYHMQTHIPKPNFSHLGGGKKPRESTNFTSPAFASPASESFSKRSDKGKLLAEINGSDIIECATDQAELSTVGNKGEKYHYMAQKLKDINEIVQDYMTVKIDFMAQKLDTVELPKLNLINQETITLFGMIIKDDDILLINEYEEIRLDLDSLEEYSLFSGMFCAVTGTNPTGAAFVVEKIHHFDFSPSEDVTDVKPEPQMKIQNTTVLVASGPFFTTDSLSNDPLNELVSNVKEFKPNLTLLMAPFLDDKHPSVKKGEITLKDFDTLLLEKIGQIEQSGSRVLLLSSSRDLYADPVYPTPIIQFPPNSKNQGYMNGDPAFINLNGWKLAITTNDILFQMVRSEMTKNAKEDKFTRIGEYIKRSGSFMPISPTPDKISLDYEQLGRIQFPFQPDIMISPSDLVPCVRSLSDESFFLNPGRLTKGRGGGSYALVQFNSNGHKIKINKV